MRLLGAPPEDEAARVGAMLIAKGIVASLELAEVAKVILGRRKARAGGG